MTTLGATPSSAAIPPDSLAVVTFAPYRNLLTVVGQVTDLSASGVNSAAQGGALIASGTSANQALYGHHLVAADLAMSPLTTKLRLKVVALVNATAPGITITAGLYPVSSVAGNADQSSITLGTVTSGSTVAFATPGASSRNVGNSGDFDHPSDGYYMVGFNLSGTPTADTRVILTAILQVHHV